MSERTTTQAFCDPQTWTVTYVVWDLSTRRAAVIDPVLDYDFKSGHTGTASADRVLACVANNALQVDWILETHAHADHLSGARYLQQRLGGKIAIGENIRAVQATFKQLFNLERSFLPDGSQFDHLFKDDETFMIGTVEATAMLVPGHTAADMAYLIDGSVYVGDTLFMPDIGSARADFPGGDARHLYASMHRLLALPSETTMYVCHDYPPASRPARWQLIAEQFGGPAIAEQLGDKLDGIADNYLAGQDGKGQNFMRLYNQLRQEKIMKAIKETATLTEKKVSLDDFRKIAEEHNHNH